MQKKSKKHQHMRNLCVVAASKPKRRQLYRTSSLWLGLKRGLACSTASVWDLNSWPVQ